MDLLPLSETKPIGKHSLHTGVKGVPVVVAFLSAAASVAAPIATNTALPLSNNELVIRQQLVFTRSSDRIADVSRDVDQYDFRTVLGYGLSSKLALFALVPFVDVSSEIGTVNASESGLADASLFARYEVFRNDQPGRTMRIAPYLGVRAPTGSEGRTGDGSTDIFGGVIATLASTKWALDSQLRYDRNREADGFQRGDLASIESSFQYRLSPRSVTRETNAFVFGVLELSASHRERNRLGGITDPNSGGFQLFLTPGIQYSTRRWIADFGARIPITNDLNGTVLEPDYSILTSIRVNF